MSDMSGHDAPERDHLHTMTLSKLEAKDAAAGVVMSRRQIMRHCATGTFDAKKLPATNNLDEWFVAPASVDRGIADIKALRELRVRRDATRRGTTDHVGPATEGQTPHDTSGHDPSRPIVPELKSNDELGPTHPDTSGHDATKREGATKENLDGRGTTRPDTSHYVVADLDIYEHPYVKRLEGQIEKLEGKLEVQVRRTEEIQQRAQDKLIELQHMTTIGQSKTLADFMLQRAKNWIVGVEAEDATVRHEEGKPTL